MTGPSFLPALYRTYACRYHCAIAIGIHDFEDTLKQRVCIFKRVIHTIQVFFESFKAQIAFECPVSAKVSPPSHLEPIDLSDAS